MAADEIDRLNRIISELKDGILNSAWSRDEQYDYRSCEICNYCEANLTKSKNKHEEGCVLLSILNEAK